MASEPVSKRAADGNFYGSTYREDRATRPPTAPCRTVCFAANQVSTPLAAPYGRNIPEQTALG